MKLWKTIQPFLLAMSLSLFLMNCGDEEEARINTYKGDDAGFTVSAISGNTTESGETATFMAKLNSRPKTDVVIGVSSSDTTEGTVSPSGLTFTSSNWDASQTVTVTGVDDDLPDGDITYSIMLSAAESGDLDYHGLKPDDLSIINLNDEPMLPDSGQTSGYTETFGEDNDYTINPPSYADNGDGTVTDNNTKIMWQQTGDGTKRIWNDAASYCQNLELSGYTDWRFPDVKELHSILDFEFTDPAINTIFTGTYSANYWSSTPDASDDSKAWRMDFNSGYLYNPPKTGIHYVRCARAGSESELWPLAFSVIDAETVEHPSTGLTWQREDDNVQRNWEAALGYCEGLTLAGKDDWRLPNIRELQSIVDYATLNPAIDATAFPNTNNGNYWSSTTEANSFNYASIVDFTDGYFGSHYKNIDWYVRCVRGGQ